MRALSVLLILVIASPAIAEDDLADARRLAGALEYERALAIVERVIAGGGADPVRIADLHLFAGQLAAGLDRSAVAENHFATLLTLRPEATLDEGTSPKLTVPFDAARAEAVPLLVSVTIEAGLVTIHPDRDPRHLISGVQVHIVDAVGHHEDVREPRALQIQLPRTFTALEISALDASGNQLRVERAPADSALAATVRSAADPSLRRSPPPYARWTTWSAVGGLALAGGVICGWRFGVAQDQWNAERASGTHDYSELVAIEDRGRSWGLAANVSFGVAAAAGLTAAIVYLTHREVPPRVTILATPGSIGVAGGF